MTGTVFQFMHTEHISLTRPEQALLAMLRAGLWMQEPVEQKPFPLDKKEWQKVYALAKAHTIVGLVCQGICMLPEELMPPQDMLELWVVHADRIERKNRRMNATVETLLGMFQSKGLHPILQKGQGVAAMYINPLQRTCGDIDFYFPAEEEREKAEQMVKDLGISIRRMPDGATTYIFEKTEVEHHPCLLDVYNPFCKGDIKQLVKDEGFKQNIPTPLVNLLLLNTHLLKHMIGPGIGLRQFADMARAYWVLDGQYDKQKFEKICHDWHISRWTSELHAFLVDYLGLPPAKLPSTTRSAALDPDVWYKVMGGGNFGFLHTDSEGAPKQGIKKKIATARVMMRDLRLSLRLSTTETFFYLWQLVRGQTAE